MNTTHLIAFHRVAAAGSFSAAARASRISQPTLSAHIRSLETSIGAPVFERTGRRIRLTSLGERLFVETAKLDGSLTQVRRIVASERGIQQDSLRVSADSAVHVLPALAELKRHSPDFTFSIRIDNSGQVLSHILTDEADVGVMARPVSDPRLYRTKLRHDRLVLLVGATHPLANRKRVSINELRGCNLVVRERGSITREVTEQQLHVRGIVTGQVFDVATREAVRETVAAGFGVGVIFQSEASSDPRLRAITLTGADLTVAEYAVCRNDRKSTGIVARFLEIARRLALEHGWIDAREA